MALDPEIPLLIGGGYYTIYSTTSGAVLQTGLATAATWQDMAPDNEHSVLNVAINLDPSAWEDEEPPPSLVFFNVNLSTLEIEISLDDDEDVMGVLIGQYSAQIQGRRDDALASFPSAAAGQRWLYNVPDEKGGAWPAFHMPGYSMQRLMIGAAWAALDPAAEVEVLATEGPLSPSGEYQVLDSAQMAILMRDWYCWHYYIWWYWYELDQQIRAATTQQALYAIEWNPDDDPPVPPNYA